MTSNLQTKAAKSLAEFPFLVLKNAGAKITINTDNRTVSDTSLTRELRASFAKLFLVFGVDDFLTFIKMLFKHRLQQKLKKLIYYRKLTIYIKHFCKIMLQ